MAPRYQVQLKFPAKDAAVYAALHRNPATRVFARALLRTAVIAATAQGLRMARTDIATRVATGQGVPGAGETRSG